MKLFFFGLVVLGLAGCGSSPRSFSIAPGASPQEREYVHEAMSMWNAVLPPDATIHEESTGGEWTIEFVDDADLPVGDSGITCKEKGNRGDGEDSYWRCPHSHWLGLAHSNRDYVDERKATAIAAHEIGHALGMVDHTTDDHSLMSAHCGSDDIEEADLELCRDEGPCE